MSYILMEDCEGDLIYKDVDELVEILKKNGYIVIKEPKNIGELNELMEVVEKWEIQ